MLDDSGRTAAAWYTCVRAARPFREVRRLPAELRLPRGFVVSLTAVLAAGAVIGFATGGDSLIGRVAEASFRASFFAYLLVSSLDLMEHFRLEKFVTGRYIGFTVVPFAETLVHGAIVTTLAAMIGRLVLGCGGGAGTCLGRTSDTTERGGIRRRGSRDQRRSGRDGPTAMRCPSSRASRSA